MSQTILYAYENLNFNGTLHLLFALNYYVGINSCFVNQRICAYLIFWVGKISKWNSSDFTISTHSKLLTSELMRTTKNFLCSWFNSIWWKNSLWKQYPLVCQKKGVFMGTPLCAEHWIRECVCVCDIKIDVYFLAKRMPMSNISHHVQDIAVKQ